MSVKQILIVDDEEDIIKLVKILLSYLTYNVKGLSDSRLLEKELKTNPPDLVLLDIQMPYINGYQACEIIKKANTPKPIKIIMFTALGDPEVIEKGKNAGANEVLLKPFSVQKLRSTIEQIIN